MKLRLIHRQTLPYCTLTLVLTQANSVLHDAEYETERQTLSSCVMLNTAERQSAMQESEEVRRGMPKCSKHEWRHGGGGEGVGGLFPYIGFCLVGSCSVGWLLCPYPARYIQSKTDSFFISKRTRFFFSLGHCLTEVFQSVHD